jgi:hypothetical protein
MSPTLRRVIGEVLFVTWAGITWYLVRCTREVSDATFSHAVLLWLGLSVPALGCVAFIVLRAAFVPPNPTERS